MRSNWKHLLEAAPSFSRRLICVASLFLLLPLFLIFLHLCVTCLLNGQDSVVYNRNIPLFISTLACHHVIFVLPSPIPGNNLGKVTFLVTFGIRISKVLGIKKFSPIYYQNFHLSLNLELALWPPFTTCIKFRPDLQFHRTGGSKCVMACFLFLVSLLPFLLLLSLFGLRDESWRAAGAICDLF